MTWSLAMTLNYLNMTITNILYYGYVLYTLFNRMAVLEYRGPHYSP